MQVLRSRMWSGLSVRLSCFSPHDLPETAGGAPLAVGSLPQFPDPAGDGQPAGSVLHVEQLPDTDALGHMEERLEEAMEISDEHLWNQSE